MKNLERFPGVERINADQCQFGAEVSHGLYRGPPVNNAIGFMSNGRVVLRSLPSSVATGETARAPAPRAAGTSYAQAGLRETPPATHLDL